MNYFVAADGSDENPGTLELPFATISKARDEIRLLKDVNEDISVYIRAGQYFLDEPVTFDERDSGRSNHKVFYCGYPGEIPEITGGRRVWGWEKVSSKQYAAYKAKVDSGTGFFGLYERDRSTNQLKRAYPARIPKDPRRRFEKSYHITGNNHSKNSFTFDFEEVNFKRSMEAYKYMRAFIWVGDVHWRWFSDIIPVMGIDFENNVITLKEDISFSEGQPIQPGVNYFLQDSMEFLEQPGEYYLDRDKGELFYIPYSRDEDVNELEIIAPTVKSIVELKGSKPDTPVKNIVFKDLILQVTDFSETYHCPVFYGSSLGGDNLEGLEHRHGIIVLKNADSCNVENCRLLHSGYCGLLLNGSSSNIIFYGNEIGDTGGNGVYIIGPIDDFSNHHNTVRNNYIHDCGKTIGHGSGVQITRSRFNLIGHNYFETIPRYGVSMKGTGRTDREGHFTLDDVSGNKIEYNLFRDIMYATRDCGFIEAYRCRGNIIDNNRAYQCRAFDDPSYAIMMDDVTNDFTITNNIIYDYTGGHYQYWDDQGNRFLREEYKNYRAFSEDEAKAYSAKSNIEWDNVGLEKDFPYETRPTLRPAWPEKERRTYINGRLRIYAVNFDSMMGITDRGLTIGNCHAGDWVCYKEVDFGSNFMKFKVYLNSASRRYIGKEIIYCEGQEKRTEKRTVISKPLIEIRLDSPDGRIIGTIEVPDTGSKNWQKWYWQVVEANLEKVSGVHDLYLMFKGGGTDNGDFLNEAAQVDWFELS